MSIYPYTPPEFLSNQTADIIHKRMLDNLPDDIDKSELSIPWDFTRPTALEKAEFIESRLNETIKIIFPHWAYGEYLDKHAFLCGLKRRPANKASGILTITGVPGTVIPTGFVFATPANDEKSILFDAVEEYAIDNTGVLSVMVTAQEGGRVGNVPQDSIILMLKPLSGIRSVTNLAATTGGSAEENDDDLRERVLEVLRGGVSFVGCDRDYVRWAKEVPGVGNAVVIPEWNGPGTVKVVLLDMDGVPANKLIVDAVYDHIVSPNDRIERLAPIGATVTVIPPVPVSISVSAKVIMVDKTELDTLKQRFIINLRKYYLQAAAERSVKYVYVGSTLAQTLGTSDYDRALLLVNGGYSNIPIQIDQFPVSMEDRINVYT